MNYKIFHNYKIYKNGTIINKFGNKLKLRIKNNKYEVKLTINSERKNFIVSRLIYYVFLPFDIIDKNLCISYKDNNSLNIHLDNLYLIHRKDLIQGEKHKTIAILTDQQIKEIKELYKGKSGNNQYDKQNYSLQDLANMYNVTKGNIASIVKNKSRDKDNYKLK